MAEYIDREEVFNKYEEERRRNGPWSFRDLISSIPAADVAPVKHGKWIPSDYRPYLYAQCSYCGKRIMAQERSNYCPCCGADMVE